jgi:PAS domain S-box-containing protein
MPARNELRKTTNFRSLTTNLTIALLALSLATLLVSSGLQTFFSYQDRQNIIVDHQNSIAQKAADEVKGFIDAKSRVLKAASHFTDLSETGKEEQKLVLEKLLGFDPSFRQVVLLDAGGRELEIASRLSNSASGNLTLRAGSDMFSQASEGNTYISPVYIDEITSEPMIVMAVPVTDVFGELKGLLLAEVNLKFMWDLVDKIKIGRSGTAYVVDRHGNLLAYSDITRVLKGENLMRLKEVGDFVGNSSLLSEKDAEVAQGILGTEVASNFVSLGTPDWAVITEMPVSEAYEPVIEQFKITLLIVIANIILVVLIAGYISKRITKPIKILSGAANEIGKGNLNSYIEVGSDDEIGQLASAFNIMTEELQATTVSRQTLQIILDSMPYGIILVGMDKKILNANHAALEMMGYESEEQIVGQICNNVLCPAKDLKCPIIDLKHKVDESEKVLLTKDGRSIPILKSVICIKLGDREVLLEAFIDISERKRAEEGLRQSEEKHRMLIENIQDGVFIIQDGVIQYANDAFARMIGYAIEEVAGRDFRQFVAPEDLEMVVDNYKRRLAGENVVREYEYSMIHKDGKTRVIVRMNVGLIDYRGRKASMGTIKDITGLKRAGEIRIENQNLAYASRAKSEFLANMSHELRTPLNSIIGFSELIKMNASLDEKSGHQLDNVLTSGKFLLNLINDILDISRVESGKMELVIEKINIPYFIDEILILIKEKASKQKIMLNKELDPSLLFLEADRQRLKQIMFNLLSNAVKFSKPEGGTITITAKREGDMAKFSVSDTGIGIREEDIGKLFSTFEQLDSGITKKYGGSGLGLAITKKLVELHGGTIKAESTYGEGSTFIFVIPIKAKKMEIRKGSI